MKPNKHALMLKKHRAIIGLTAILTDKKGNKYEVPCTALNVKSDDIQANEYVDKKSIKLKFLIADLKEVGAPIIGTAYEEVKYKTITYKTSDPNIIGGFDDTLTIYGVVYG